MRSARTWMFVPGANRRQMEKALLLPADALIFDLEDAVAGGEKENARKQVKGVLQRNVAPGSPARYVRINGADTPYFEDDVREVAEAGLDGIVLPKVEGPEQVHLLEKRLEQVSHPKPGERVVEIVPIIESACGLYRACEIAGASRRIRRLLFGAIDFALDIGAELTKDGLELLYARSQLVVVSRAAGIEAPIDSVFPDLQDETGLVREARMARQLGFQGKLLIHPKQIEPVNRVFAPSGGELAEAREIVAAY